MAGIYIHIPFCKQKCSYCDFHFSTTFQSYRERMIECMVKELQTRKESLQNEPIQTIYFGGGTPSLLNENELVALLKTIYTHFTVVDFPEITLEANPDDIHKEQAEMWVRSGINRLSIGLQSFNPSVMKWMNRAHTVEQSKECIPIAQQAGIKNISIDLIYGLPDLTLSEWENEIDTALQLGIQHISAYCLTIEEKTALASWVKSKKINKPSNENQALQFELLQNKLKQAGFDHYEISNFGLPDFYSKHNSSYWKGELYLGIGPSAHSFDGKYRSWNIANNTLYMKGIESNQPDYDFELLTPENRFNELLLVGLRTRWGVDIHQLSQILPLSDDFQSTLSEFISKGWVSQNETHIYLTDVGKSWADKIAEDLFVL
jgi:oxygen-independent coproporphyrinogen-3 oxidase